MSTRIFANKVDYIAFLMNHPDIAKKIGSRLLLPAVAIVNFMLFKKGYCSTEESSKRNRVYRGSIDSYLEHLPGELVAKAVKKLILIGQIWRTDRDELQLSDSVLQYFYELTENETFNTSENSETRERDKTDNRLSTLPYLASFRNGELEELFERQRIDIEDFKKEHELTHLLFIFVVHFKRETYQRISEPNYIEDLEVLFAHFGANKSRIKPLWPEEIEKYNYMLTIEARAEERRRRGVS